MVSGHQTSQRRIILRKLAERVTLRKDLEAYRCTIDRSSVIATVEKAG